MEKKRKIKDKGILFWITGLSGSGKTQIAKKIKNQISKIYGPTIFISGDDMRKIFELKEYTKKARIAYGIKLARFYKFVTDQNINIIFAVVSLRDKIRKWNKKTISNYIEIYIKADIKKIMSIGKKKIYKNFNKNIVGIDIIPEFPKSPNITIENNFNKSVKRLSDELLKKIKKTI